MHLLRRYFGEGLDMSSEFTKKEIVRLKQLVCEHIDTKEYGMRCTCCDNNHEEKCTTCGKILVTKYAKQCDEEHSESDDGYCNRCR